MMKKGKKQSDGFNRAAKGAAVGVAGAFAAGAILPILPVSLPVLAVGGAIGAWLNRKK